MDVLCCSVESYRVITTENQTGRKRTSGTFDKMYLIRCDTLHKASCRDRPAFCENLCEQWKLQSVSHISCYISNSRIYNAAGAAYQTAIKAVKKRFLPFSLQLKVLWECQVTAYFSSKQFLLLAIFFSRNHVHYQHQFYKSGHNAIQSVTISVLSLTEACHFSGPLCYHQDPQTKQPTAQANKRHGCD